MIRKLLAGLRERVRSFWDLEDPEERIEGSGEVYLDPAYNGRYEGERELTEQAKLPTEADEEYPDGTEQSPPSGRQGGGTRHR